MPSWEVSGWGQGFRDLQPAMHLKQRQGGGEHSPGHPAHDQELAAGWIGGREGCLGKEAMGG